jgi:hypothetical protein
MQTKPKRKSSSKPADFNIVFRYSAASEKADTIREHMDVAKELGSVWLGIAGTGLSERTIKGLNDDIEIGGKRYLYLTKRVKDAYESYRAEILECESRIPKDRQFVPAYYKQNDLLYAVKVWLRLKDFELVPAKEFAKLSVSSTGSNLEESLRRGAKTILFVNPK